MGAQRRGRSRGWDELWERLWENAVDVPGPLVAELEAACARLGMFCAIGVNEREAERPGSLYNTLLLIGPEGLLHKHRKLMPTQHERLFHGIGEGRDLGVAATELGRIGGLICWENRMPLARYAVYRGGPQIWVAPTADDSDGWLASMRHIAIESGAFVVSVPQFIPGAAFPDDFPVPIDRERIYGRGGAAIVEPVAGRVIEGPLYDREGMVVADCDLREGLHAKRWFDAVGHYSREDVLLAVVTTGVPSSTCRWRVVPIASRNQRSCETATIVVGDAASARSSTSSVSKSRWLVGSSSSSRSASEATIAAIAARARWPGLRRSSGRRTASAPRPKWASSVRASRLVDAGRGVAAEPRAAAGRWRRRPAGAGGAGARSWRPATSPRARLRACRGGAAAASSCRRRWRP